MSGERVRRLEWEGCLNVRDLGGLPTSDGRETRRGAVIRADNLAPLSKAGRAALRAAGVRTIIDLRAPAELRDYPNPFAAPGDHGIRYLNLPLIDPAAGPPPPFATFAETYIRMLDAFAERIAAILETIAEAPPGGVVIHCMGGKDRTGLIAALLLAVAGVEPDVIAADYALTADCLRPQEADWLAAAETAEERARREAELAWYAPTPAVMLTVLAHLDERYGGPIPYLRAGSLSEGAIGALRQRLRA